ncbi:MAG: hypothetical protein JXB05_11725 [Myxococcaceae bacterium]|nr:hypothetical protein [Myxococcaceae bacterium]
MPRMQLIELEDQAWYPRPVRDGATDFLSFTASLAQRPFVPFAQELSKALRRTGDRKLVDLCSGGSGPIRPILRALKAEGLEVSATLTDLYPNVPRLEAVVGQSQGTLSFVREPVDATDVPASLEGFRVLCNAFHHFPPQLARKILEDAVRKRRGIAVVEYVERRTASLALTSLAWLQAFLLTPAVRPFRWSRLFFTYVLPLIPLTLLWDGIVSCLRVYSTDELRALVDSIPEADVFEWHIERRPIGPLGCTMLIGVPKALG